MARYQRRRRNTFSTLELAILGLAVIIALIGRSLSLEAAIPLVVALLGLMLLAVIIIVARQYWRGQERLRALRILKLTDVDRMTGVQFESYVAELLVAQGYKVSTTPTTGDYGVDLVARKDGTTYAVQLKRYNKPLNQLPIREAVAGKAHYKCTAAMVITNSTFNKAAKTLAESNDCVLIDRNALAQWVAAFQATSAT